MAKRKKSFIGFFNLPKGMTRRLYLKNLIALALLLALAVAAFTLHTADHAMWIRNYMSKGYAVDSDQLEKAVGKTAVEPAEQSAIDQKYLVTMMGIASMVEQKDVYFQDEKDYRFAVTVDAVEDTGIYYDDTYRAYFGVTDVNAWLSEVEALEPIQYEATQGVMADYYIMPLLRLVKITSNGLDFLVLANYDAVIAQGDTLRGIFTRWCDYDDVDGYKVADHAFPEFLMADYGHSLYLSGGSGETVLSYVFETCDVPVEFEDENWGYMVFYGIITLVVLLLNAVFYVWPYVHPFFRQIQKYGEYDEVIASVDEDFAQGKHFIENRKTILGDQWYIKKSNFMTVINRNPDRIPENQMAREGQINKRRYSDYAEKKPAAATEEKYDPLKENMKNRYNKYY